MSECDGGPAFPALVNWSDTRTGEPVPTGMTLRDWFAGQALIGLVPFIGIPEDGPDELWDADTAKRAYALADAMLAARTALKEKNNG